MEVPVPEIKTVEASDTRAMTTALERDGVVIVRDALPIPVTEGIASDLAAGLDAQEPGGGAFYGKRAKRLAGLVAKSAWARKAVAAPAALAAADAVLAPNCINYRLSLSAALQVWSGGDPQPLHRDGDIFAPFIPLPGPLEPLISVMAAITNFTDDNGATRLVPGSHRWPSHRVARDSDVATAVMPRGSLAIWLGSTLHGMGVNRTSQPRLGMVWGYSLGWLRQEEEQFLLTPPDIAATLDDQTKRLIGYQTHGPFLGWTAGNDTSSFDEGAPDAFTRSHLLV
jgi:ectoine hydroxylase-related dioxygenase (phytanoyl-CoA dioxygenase family)